MQCLSSIKGATLIELVVFIIVVSAAFGGLINTMANANLQSADPIIKIKALEKAQAQLDEILARRFDENVPNGGVPTCDTPDGLACAGIVADADYDDVGDFNGFTDNTDPSFPISVTVVLDGATLGITNAHAKLITVTVGMPGGDSLSISAYKVNF